MYIILLLELSSMKKNYVIKRKKYALKYIEETYWEDELIKIEKHIEQRTLKQNRKYWGFFLKYIKKRLKEENGIFTCEDDLHEEFKRRFLTKKICSNFTNETFNTIQSSADLNKLDFGKFMQTVNQWLMSEMWWHVPLDEVTNVDEVLQREQEFV